MATTTFFEAVTKFFSPKDEVHKHWYCPVDNFQFSSADFYQMIEKELAARNVPGLEVARVDLSEGGMLSDKREYLRLKRERLVFDICAAPFGTSYFFSFRFVELALGIKPWELCILVLSFPVIVGILVSSLGIINGFIWLVILSGTGMYIMRNAVAFGLKDLDATLLKTPVVGALYEVFFRKETYYRQDTRLMYLSTVNSITETLVDEVTGAKGIKLVRRFDRKSIQADLYEERTRSDNKGVESPLKAAA